MKLVFVQYYYILLKCVLNRDYITESLMSTKFLINSKSYNNFDQFP